MGKLSTRISLIPSNSNNFVWRWVTIENLYILWCSVQAMWDVNVVLLGVMYILSPGNRVRTI